MKKFKLFVLIVFVCNFSFAQGEAALPFLTLQQSNLLLGAGQIGVSIPNNDVLGFYLNPAILGFTSKKNHASVYSLTKKTEWFWDIGTFNNNGVNIGYNLESKIKFPLSIGVGFLHKYFDFGKANITTDYSPQVFGTIERYDKFDCFSLGAGIDYFVKLNFGISLKSFDSQFGAEYTGTKIDYFAADGRLLDYGILITFPFSELFKSDLDFQLDEFSTLTPNLNLSVGYSLTNVGDEIHYIDDAQRDPLPRTARFGYTLELGYHLFYKETKISLINYSFSAEANDILVINKYFDDGYLSGSQISYQNSIGDINIIDHVIKLNPDEKVIVHKGHIFNFFDTMILTKGSYQGRGYYEVRKTDGIGFSTKGIFNLINAIIENPTIKFITKHFQVDYFDSNVEFFKGYKSNFNGISLHFIGFEI